MAKFFRGVGVALMGSVAVLGLLSVLGNTVLKGSPLMTIMQGAFGSAGTGAANALIDASGIKGRIDAELRSRAGEIAAATGLSEDEVGAAIDALDVQGWSAAELPAGATAQGSVDATYAGVDATVTTYDDPGYVTVDMGGQDVTLAVPESAQGYLGYLGYLG